MLSDLFQMIQSQLVSIPVTNIWAYIYVILNAVLLLLAGRLGS